MDRNTLLYGRPETLPESVTLQAGPLSLVFANGDIRYLKLGDHEILRRVYAAVRDHNWGTILPQVSNVQMDVEADSFAVTFDVAHRQHDIDFGWHGQLTGSQDGTVTFRFDGTARSTFRCNRIGLCVLHPMTCAGQECTVRHVDGSITEGSFPGPISPHQPFFNIQAITHEVMPGVRAEVIMEGDTFEMEDQRNWTDASYKTYSTPLAVPFPVTVEQGTRIQQSVTIKLHGYDSTPLVAIPASQTLTFRIQPETKPLPAIGLGMASHALPLSAIEIERLKELHLAHLRVDVRLDSQQWQTRLTEASQQAEALGIGLEVAVFVTDNADVELQALRAASDKIVVPVARWLIFHVDEKTTTARWVTLARQFLGDVGAPIGAGTDSYFTELNRERPPVDIVDFVSYSLNPQVHAFENMDLVETLATQAVTVSSARLFSASKPIIVSPVTLKPRHNPNATGLEPAPAFDALPAPVDVRQMSLLGAAWIVGSLKYLAESGVESVTYFETTGWRGVLATAEGAALPPQFHAIPGSVYPLYHVLADVGAFAGGEISISISSDSLKIDGLVLRKGGQTRILLANLRQTAQTVILPDVIGEATVKMIDETNGAHVMQHPEVYRAEHGMIHMAGQGGLTLSLLPYAVACIDLV